VLGIAACLLSRIVSKLLAQKPPQPAAPPCRTKSVSVVGNIGCGKSTALREFARFSGDSCRVVEEPIAEWGKHLDSVDAKDRAAGLTDLQASIASFYLDKRNFEPGDKVKTMIVERGLESTAIFGLASPPFLDLLTAVCSREAFAFPDAVVYIATDSNTCFERIEHLKRNQPGDSVALELGANYFVQLEALHDAMARWYARNGVVVVTVSDESKAQIALREAVAHVRDDWSEPKMITPEMMKDLIASLQEARLGLRNA
jgi:hypothetical protein